MTVQTKDNLDRAEISGVGNKQVSEVNTDTM